MSAVLRVEELEIVLGDFSLTTSFECAPGSILAITGPNGSGKSSILESIAGILRPFLGNITLGETVFDDQDAHLPAESRYVGYVPQRHELFGHMSAVENVAFGLRMRGLGTQDSKKQALHWLTKLGLTQFADTKANRLSGGQSQRVAIARAFCSAPKVLLLDEPFSALDAGVRQQTIDLVNELVAELNIPTVLVSHDSREVTQLAKYTISVSR